MTSMWPDNFGGCTLTGSYLGLDGTPVAGTITISARPPVLIDYDRDLIILPRALTITLDILGRFTKLVPATDDPDISPVDWTYTVNENFPGGRTYDISAPLGTTLDLSDASPVPTSTGNPIVRGPRGFAGGVQKVQGISRDENDNVDLSSVVPVLTNAGWTVANAAAFRTALGLGSAATQDDSHYSLATEYANTLKKNLNLGDIPNTATARQNLGLSPSQIRDTLGLADAWTNTQVQAAIAAAVTSEAQYRAALPTGILSEVDASDPGGTQKLTGGEGGQFAALQARTTVTLQTRRRVSIEVMATVVGNSTNFGIYTVTPGYNAGTAVGSFNLVGVSDAASMDGSRVGTRVSIRTRSSITLDAGTYTFYPVISRAVGGATTDAVQYSQQVTVTDMGAG